MPDGGIIALLLLFGVIGVLCLLSGWKGNWDGTGDAILFYLSLVVFVAGFVWLRVADVNRAEEVDWFFLHTVTCDDGTTTQLFIDGDDIFNATTLLGKTYPDNGWVIERRQLADRKYGIKFECLEDEVSYRAIAPNEASDAN
jgi:hypothetical protein